MIAVQRGFDGEQGKYPSIWNGREARLWTGAGGCLCFVKPSFVCARCKWNDMTVRRRFMCCLSHRPLRIRAQPPRTRRVVLGDRPIPFLRLSACWQVRGIGTRRTWGLGWGGCLCFFPPSPLPVYLHIKGMTGGPGFSSYSSTFICRTQPVPREVIYTVGCRPPLSSNTVLVQKDVDGRASRSWCGESMFLPLHSPAHPRFKCALLTF